MESTQRAKTTTRPASPPTGAARAAAAPVAVGARAPVSVQPSLRVSSPSDPAEREAESTARRVMRMAAPVATPAAGRPTWVHRRPLVEEEKERKPEVRRRMLSPYLARFAAAGALPKEEEKKLQRQALPKEEERKLQRQPLPKEEEKKLQRQALPKEEEKKLQRSSGGGRAAGVPDVGPAVAAEIRSSTSAGTPLPLSVRRFMEPRFGLDFGGVRVHADDRAAGLNRQVSARAFTYGNHIFFGRGEFQPDSSDGRELIAHELTHTVQQGGAVRRSEAPAAVTQRSEPQVQRLGISDALDYFAERAYNIPGFRMFTVIIGLNPINMQSVERSPSNILRAAIEFIPGGNLITRALDNYGIIDRVAGWVAAKFRELGMVGASFRRAIMDFLDSLSWRDVFRLGDVWRRAQRIFTEPIDRLISFARTLGSEILGFIRDAILRPLASLAEGTRGFDLLCAILGQNPITGDPVPRNADTLIGGFMRLIGQQEIWENIKRANAVARAWAWFQGAMAGLIGFVRAVPGQFMAALRSLEIADLVVLPRAFAKVGRVFLGVAGQFLSWAGQQVMGLLQIIFEVVAPGAMPYLRRTGAALMSIFRNPIPFVGNLVRAGILGFRNFAANFLTHLRGSLIGWLTGAMAGAGVYIPQGFTLQEIIKFVLSVLGVTWQNIRQKIVRVIGEPAMRALETGFELITTLITRGPAALWERIQEGISNLREMVMEQVMSFVQTRIVQAAITRLVTSLNPAGAFIQAIIAIYNTVMFFVERLRQIAQVAMAFVDSMVAIASGNITAAAQRVERTMAGLLTLVISFLARLVGLGRVSDAVTNIIARIRAPIDRALDRAVEWIVAQARRLGRLVVGAVTGRGAPTGPDQRTPEQKLADVRAAVTEATPIAQDENRGLRVRERAIAAIRTRYRLTALEMVRGPAARGRVNMHVRGTLNPTYDGAGFIISDFPPQPIVVVETDLGAPQARAGFENVLEPGSQVGLPGYERAHLVGAGFGAESPLGVMYAPRRVNQELQNRGIEQLIRAMVATAYPGVTISLRATAVPHSGTQILSRVSYVVFGQRGDEPRTQMMEVRITVSRNTGNPTVRVNAGDIDLAAVQQFSQAGRDLVRSIR